MDSIRQRFLQAEQDFLSSARSSDMLATFADRWETLQSDWESCSGEADRGTRQLVDGIVAKIHELATDFYAFESRSSSLEDDLFSNLEDVFAALTLEDPVIEETSDEITRPGESSPPGRSIMSPSEWLLRNLHNPYPLPHVKFSMGRSMSSKHTKDWFAKARQRIGWTRLLRDRFAGCRSLATDAAFRAFIRDDPSNPLDTDLETAFLAIKSHAELVYGDEELAQFSLKRSRSISPTPSLSSSSSSEDTDDEHVPLQPPMSYVSGPLKRASPRPSDRRLSKRLRTVQSPPSYLQKCVPLQECKTATERPRKRRLSESDNDCSQPKRPKGVKCGRPHAVSDPLLVSTTPTWFGFDQSFQIPSPASVDPLELSSFDLDFFQLPSFPSCATSPPEPLPDLSGQTDDFSVLFEMPQLDLLQPTPQILTSDWSEFLNFEPDLSIFSPSLASTPPLLDDATLSPSPPSRSSSSSPYPFVSILPHPHNKGSQLQTTVGPVIYGQDFLLPPGENAGILSASAVLSAC